MIKGAIFDMDGVISQTPSLHAETESEIFKKYGISITPQEIVNQYSGQPDRFTFKDVFEKHSMKVDIAQVRQEKWKIMEEKAKGNIQEVEGVKTLIDDLISGGLTLAVASSSPRIFIENVLHTLQIINKFQAIVSGDEITNGKPDPEIFLLAAQRLNVQPEECIVFEDARNGIDAAINGHMKVIAITTSHKKEALIKADKIIDSFKEISIETIKNLSNHLK